MEQKGIQFNYRYSMATADHLLEALRENPVGLHFSGHGFLNTENLYKDDKKGFSLHKDKGDVLIFENEDGASDFFFTSDLEQMMKDVKE